MNAGDIIKRLRDAQPARQHGDICNKAHIAHELITLGPGIAAKHSQLSLIWSKAKNRVECGGLACTVGANEPKNAALFNAQIDALQRDGCAEGLAEAACFYACHNFIPPSWGDLIWCFAMLQSPGVQYRKTPSGFRR